MKFDILRSLVFLALLAGWSTATLAQDDISVEDADTIKANPIVVTGQGNRSVAAPKRINDRPQLVNDVPEAPKVNYQTQNRQLNQEFDPEPINAPRMRGVPLPNLYRGHAKVGLGNYGTSMADIHVSSLRSREKHLNARYRHFASSGQLDDVGPSNFSQNRLDLFGKKYYKKHTLGGGFTYDRNVVHFYGFNPSEFDTISKGDIRQRFSKVAGDVELQSFYKDSASINHNIKARGYNLTDLFEANESNVRVDAKLSRYFKQEQFVVDLGFDYNNFKMVGDTQSNGIVFINPKVVSRGDRWNLSLGMNVMTEFDEQSNFHFYPNAQFRYKVLGDIIIPYVGITGGLSRNSFNSLTQENPFMVSAFELRNTNTKYEYYGGVRGAYSATTSFNFQFAKSKLEDMHFFVADSTNGVNNRFTVVYDTVVVTHLSGQISHQKTDKLNLLLRADYFAYNMSNEFEAWQRPNLRITFAGRYQLNQKLLFEASVFGFSGMVARSFDAAGAEESYGSGIFGDQLDGIVDLNLGVEYRYTERLGVFLKLNNLASMRYNRWQNYPTQRFNVLGGLSYSFWGK